MNNVDYKAMLYEKMNNEQNSYRKWLLSQPHAEILNHTYEYTTREDILMCMEELSLQPKQAKAMLKSPCPLKDVYENIRKRSIQRYAQRFSRYYEYRGNVFGFEHQ